MIKTRISILFLFASFYTLAQDIHFSQFNDLPLALNPSLAGYMYSLVILHSNDTKGLGSIFPLSSLLTGWPKFCGSDPPPSRQAKL